MYHLINYCIHIYLFTILVIADFGKARLLKVALVILAMFFLKVVSFCTPEIFKNKKRFYNDLLDPHVASSPPRVSPEPRSIWHFLGKIPQAAQPQRRGKS